MNGTHYNHGNFNHLNKIICMRSHYPFKSKLSRNEMKKTYENNNNNFHGNKSLVYIPIFNCNLNTLINENAVPSFGF